MKYKYKAFECVLQESASEFPMRAQSHQVCIMSTLGQNKQ